MIEKTCTKCSTSKPVDQFQYIATRWPDRKFRTEQAKYNAWCKKCTSIVTRKSPSSRFNRYASNISVKGGAKITGAQLRALGLPEDADCYLCGEAVGTSKPELDHVVPRSLGGENTVENLRWTHKTCNRMKHDMSVAEMLDRMSLILAHHGRSVV